MAKSVTPVILCGGAGSRLWPASRESYPKQLFALGGGNTLFQETVKRVSGDGFQRPIIVTGSDYRFLVAEQLRALDVEADVLLEPVRRDSCAAIAAAAALAAGRDPGNLLLVLASDHAIPDSASFHAHVARGIAAADAGHIVTFGIRPSHASTEYGYIRPGAALADIDGAVHAVDSFVEKPDCATAVRYVADGYLWNSGNFLFRADTFLGELAALAADVHTAATQSVASASRDLDFTRLDPGHFGKARATSVDYAVMQKTARMAVVASDFAWSDVGSWSAVWELANKDAEGNAGEGDVVFHGARNCYAHSPNVLTTVVGLDNVVVVTTRDAILVTAKDRSAEVKSLVGRLAKMGRREAREHLRMYRPWGDYEQIDRRSRYQVKRITVKPGGTLSLQSHYHRAEHWVVVSGTARITVGEEEHLLVENQSIYVPLGAIHRLENPGRIPLELIEVQSGSYLGEDDIIRYKDVYNRQAS